MEQLLTRLRNGQTWLADAQERLLAMERVGIGSKLEAQFLDAIELWDNLDMVLRSIYPEFQACVLGQGKVCAGNAPVRCRHCGREREGDANGDTQRQRGC